MMASVTGGGFTFSLVSVGGTWTWTVQASNVQGANQFYQISNILTPFGKITDVDTPLPGDVVQAMASSLAQFQQQLSPLLALVSPTPPIFNLTVTEGDPSTQAGILVVRNSGAFGSFMTASATGDAPWLAASPSTVPGLSQNDQGTFNVAVNPALMLAANSPYTGHINLQDNRTPPTIVPATVNVIVRPRPSLQISPNQINLTWSLGTGSGNGSQQVTITNVGPQGSQMNYVAAKVQNSSPWLAFTPASGGPLAQNAFDIITFSLVTQNVPLVVGTFSETVLISSNNAANAPLGITVILTVTQ